MGAKQKKIKLDRYKDAPRCKFYIARKNRKCKLVVGKSGQYCAEHEVAMLGDTESVAEDVTRMPCPYDPTHSVNIDKLDGHLRVCNARPKIKPPYIEVGINTVIPVRYFGKKDKPLGPRLYDLDLEKVKTVIEKVKSIYNKYQIEGLIKESFQTDESVEETMKNPIYGPQTKKHMIQTSSLIGNLRESNLLLTETAYLDFGGGKGEFSFWQSTVLKDYENSKVILVDKMSHRHKKDNKIANKNLTERIRADIADLNVKKLDVIDNCKQMIVISKHLCGVASDLAFRCIVNGNKELNETSKPVVAFLIAFCCHHKCEWNNFVGQKLFTENELGEEEFSIISKMVGWAVCGNGLSRDHSSNCAKQDTVRGPDELNKFGLTKDQQTEIGYMCKKIIDYARAKYMEENNFTCTMKYYVNNKITLENVCLIGQLNK